MNIYKKLYENQVFDQEWANEVVEWEGILNLSDSKIQSLPELKSIGRNLILQDSQIQSLPKLKSVGGYLDLSESKIQSLPKLKSVRDWLDLESSQIQSLPELESVGNWLDLRNSQIQSLPKLKYIRSTIFVDEHQYYYWKLYFLKTGRKHLIEKLKVGE